LDIIHFRAILAERRTSTTPAPRISAPAIALRIDSSAVEGLASDAPGAMMPPIETVRTVQRIDSLL
jgi:hypothetical protein